MNTSLVRRILSKPLPVILFRLKQSLVLACMARFGVWPILSARLERSALCSRSMQVNTTLLPDDKPTLNSDQSESLKAVAESVLTSGFRIFGQQVPDLDTCDFSTDWRFDHYWKQQYFKHYQFYEYKKIPYDVKFPWELSRMHYLIPVLAEQWVGKLNVATLRWVHNFLVRWRGENPLAYSVNWYPMEASMRAINLALMLDFVCVLSKDAAREDEKTVLQDLELFLQLMLEEHGAFIWANREFTDVRGNHFTANLVALLLVGQALHCKKRRHRNWVDYALEWLDREVLLQFCSDGVNFEKSCAYHKLVLELFLVTAIVRDKMGNPFSTGHKKLLQSAARFSDALTRPDGLAANFGDTDDAVVLPFDIECPRSHGSVVELARNYFDSSIGTVAFADKYQLSSLFFLGAARQSETACSQSEVLSFPDGGYVVVRHQAKGFFAMVDIGEVGMAGRGGHGHNDLLAFELCVSGKTMVVDPGCSGYTADLDKKARYRSTASHSTVELFAQEMARFAGHWAIHNDALPLDISVQNIEGGVQISATHTGYERIAEGCRVTRTFTICPDQQILHITDLIQTPVQSTPACWHFPVGIAMVQKVDERGTWVVENSDCSCAFKAQLPVTVVSAPYSEGYGQEVDGQVIEITARVPEGEHQYRFCFEAIQG